MMWMNKKALKNNAYCPTSVEHLANIITHGLSVIPACYGATVLYGYCKLDIQKYSAVVFGAALTSLFLVSTIFHISFYIGTFTIIKELLHRCDRAMIYIFIASSYTSLIKLKPFPVNSWSESLWWGIWLLAVIGIMYQQFYHEKYKMVETLLYVIIGVFPAMSIIEMEDMTGISELKMGGVVYLIGVIFFKMDGTIPFAHAIWHIFVVAGSYIHYFALLNLIEKTSNKIV